MELKRKTAILQKIVFELRYRRGYLYLDKCGRTVDALMANQPEWVLKDESVSPQNAPLISLRNQCALTFSSKKLDLGLEMQPGGEPLTETDIDTFTGQVEAASALIIEELGLRDFERIGFRTWYLFPFQTMAECRDWVVGLGLIQVSNQFRQAFGDKLNALGASAVFEGSVNFRVAVNQVERTAQIDLGQEILNVRASKLANKQREVFLQQLKVKKRMLANPEFAVMIDVDAFQDEPKTLSLREFVQTSISTIQKNLVDAAK
jgi:hypothetical protein